MTTRFLPLFLVLAVAAFAVEKSILWLGTGVNPLVGHPKPQDVFGGAFDVPHLARYWLRTMPATYLGILLAATITHRTYGCLTGASVSVLDDLSAVRRNLAPLLYWCILVTILTFLMVLPTALVTGGMTPAVAAAGSAGGAQAAIWGAILVMLVIVGLAAFLALALMVAVPALIVERLGFVGALRRSVTLTKGHRGDILVFWIVYFVAAIGAACLVWIATGTGVNALSSAALSSPAGLANSLLEILKVIILPVGTTVIYSELRRIEGAGTSPAAQVPQPQTP